jgi:two-component system, sensor histidine kinase PdtaS
MLQVQTPIHSITDLKPGDHVCCIYDTDEEHQNIITPFLRKGLEQNEKVYYIVDARDPKTIINYLKTDDVDVKYYQKKGQFNILSSTNTYLKGGVFEPDGMMSILSYETQKALDEGYTALRFTGEMSWALRGLPGSERLIEYEDKLDTFSIGSKFLAICQYDRRCFSKELFHDMLVIHPFAIIGTSVYNNFYYVPPKERAKENQSGKKPNSWISNLMDYKATEEALRGNEERLRGIVENTQAGYFFIDREGRFQRVNDAWLCMHGYDSPDEVIGQHFALTQVETDLKAAQQIVEELFAGHRIQSGQFSRRCKDGSVGYHTFTAHPVVRGSVMVGLEGFLIDITERKRAEETLQDFNKKLQQGIEEKTATLHESELRHRMLFESSRDAIMTLEPPDWRFTSGNPATITMFRAKDEAEFTSAAPWELSPECQPDGRPSGEKAKEMIEKAVQEGSNYFEWTHKRLNGEDFPATVLLTRFEWKEKKILQATVRDITEQKHAEDKIKASLDEKVLLLREVHHRVRNNLQIILSLIRLQSRNIKDPNLLDTMEDFQNRIKAMAHVHERMCRAEDISRIDLSEIVTFLGTSLFKSYKVDHQHIRLNVEMKDLQITIDSAIPISLIINELISNSIKHAFPKGTPGEIIIAGCREADTLVLSIRDTGIGIPKDFDWMRSKQSIGLRLVVILVEQLNGTIELDRTTGTAFNIVVHEK